MVVVIFAVFCECDGETVCQAGYNEDMSDESCNCRAFCFASFFLVALTLALQSYGPVTECSNPVIITIAYSFFT